MIPQNAVSKTIGLAFNLSPMNPPAVRVKRIGCNLKTLTGEKMKKLLTFLLILVFCFAFNPAASAKTTRPKARVGTSNRNCANIKFHYLNKYKGNRWSTIFRDREVAPALRTLLKQDYGLFKESLAQATYPDNADNFMDKNGVLTLEGGVKGLYTIMEAALIIEPCGNIYAMLLNEGKRFLYFTNDQKHLNRLPAAIEEWRSNVESRRSQNREEPKLPVIFKSK